MNPLNIKEISIAMEKIASVNELRENLINKGSNLSKRYNWRVNATRLGKYMQNSTEDRESLVSIIVPMYNEEKRIGKCIESLIHQSYPSNKYEIVIVSDGCTE